MFEAIHGMNLLSLGIRVYSQIMKLIS